METISFTSLGKITIKTVRNYILDEKLSPQDKIYLHPDNYDDLILEHRKTYSKTAQKPYYLISVLLDTSKNVLVAFNTIHVKKNKNKTPRLTQIELEEQEKESEYSSALDEIFYRCGWCGNVVESDGSLLNDDIREYKISLLRKYENELSVYKVHGDCCPHESDD